MQFECTPFYQLGQYVTGSVQGAAGVDRVITTDLDLDGRDDILIIADAASSELIVFMNNTLTSSP
ncbi:MAG: hypothetical protein AAF937_05875 [Planctomycetota bacterium]